MKYIFQLNIRKNDFFDEKEILNVNVLCPFDDLGLSILLQNNVTFVVMMQTIILNIVALCHNEILGPSDGWHEVVNDHSFWLRGNLFVELLIYGANNREAMSQR